MFEELKKMFIVEVKELLEKLEKDLLDLEKDLHNIDLVNNIFRYLHTIKGAAGMYGLNKTVQLAHSFEDIFKKIQNNELEANYQIINLSLQAKDLLLQLIETDEKAIDDNKIQKLIEHLQTNSDEEILHTELDNNSSAQDTTLTKSFYILFEPNKDIYERGINLTAIIEELQNTEYSLVTPFEQTKKDEEKLNLFWEIIIATKNEKLLDNIFIFVQDEITKTQICNCNIFELPNFKKFYKSLEKNFSNDRINKIIDFVSKHAPDKLTHKTQQLQKNQQDYSTTDDLQTQSSVEQFKTIKHIRIPAQQLDELLNLVSQLIINNAQLDVAIDNKDINQIAQIGEKLQTLINSIKDSTLRLRLIPINALFSSYERLVRDLSQKLGKKVKFVTDGGETLIDKSIVEKLYTPILHIIRNAIDHGIETPEEREKMGKPPEGIVRLIAFQSNINVIIQVQDDGRGIDPEQIKNKAVELGLLKHGENVSLSDIYELIFTPGFTTAKNISEISGRGMGMDVIRQSIRELRGNVEIDSEKNLGTSITIKLPATLSIIESLHVSTNNFHFLIPISNIIICEKINPKDIQNFSGNRLIYNDEPIPYLDLRKLFNLGGDHSEEENLIIVDLGSQKIGLIFEKIHGEISAVVKHLGHIFYALEFFIGASILGDGSIAYIIDPYKITKAIKSPYVNSF